MFVCWYAHLNWKTIKFQNHNQPHLWLAIENPIPQNSSQQDWRQDSRNTHIQTEKSKIWLATCIPILNMQIQSNIAGAARQQMLQLFILRTLAVERWREGSAVSPHLRAIRVLINLPVNFVVFNFHFTSLRQQNTANNSSSSTTLQKWRSAESGGGTWLACESNYRRLET